MYNTYTSQKHRQRERNVYTYIYMGRERRGGEEEEKERKKGGKGRVRRGEGDERTGESGSKCLKRRWLVGPTIFARAHTYTRVGVRRCEGIHVTYTQATPASAIHLVEGGGWTGWVSGGKKGVVEEGREVDGDGGG